MAFPRDSRAALLALPCTAPLVAGAPRTFGALGCGPLRTTSRTASKCGVCRRRSGLRPVAPAQAAKYFTFVFFGLSVFVIVLFAGYVLVHCYRRIRSGPALPQADAEARPMCRTRPSPSSPAVGWGLLCILGRVVRRRAAGSVAAPCFCWWCCSGCCCCSQPQGHPACTALVARARDALQCRVAAVRACTSVHASSFVARRLSGCVPCAGGCQCGRARKAGAHQAGLRGHQPRRVRPPPLPCAARPGTSPVACYKPALPRAPRASCICHPGADACCACLCGRCMRSLRSC